MAVTKAYGARKVVAFDVEQSCVDFAVKHYADVGAVCPKISTDDMESFARNFVLTQLKENLLETGTDVVFGVTGVESAALIAIPALRAQRTCKFSQNYARGLLTICPPSDV